MRIDKFLKLSRIIKRRTVANEACSNDRVFINGKLAKPSTSVNIGDIITINLGNRQVSYKITMIKDIIKKEEADLMYEVINE